MLSKKETLHSPGPVFYTNEIKVSLPQVPGGIVLRLPGCDLLTLEGPGGKEGRGQILEPGFCGLNLHLHHLPDVWLWAG